MRENVTIIIPTFNGGELFKQCLNEIKSQNYDGEIQLIVIDSGSTDETMELAKDAGAEVIQIPQEEFHHSRTRNKAIRYANHNYVVLMVQDCIPQTGNWLASMVQSITTDDVVGVSFRQIPHDDADIFARFEVEYHNEYLGNNSIIQAIDNHEEFYNKSFDEALKVIRFDNVCAIYKKDILDEIPLPDIAFGEDMAWAKEALMKGYKVKYDPNVMVKHSHNRSPEYRFRRAIIDIMCCIEVVERLRVDLSFVKPAQIFYALKLLESSKQLIYQNIKNNSLTKENSVDISMIKKMSVKFPLVKKLIWKIINLLNKSSESTWITTLGKSSELHVEFVMQEIKKRFPNVSSEELVLSSEQVMAQIQGRVLGEVMMSYKMKGEIPNEISQLVNPHLKGV